jgi:hypothetical protein
MNRFLQTSILSAAVAATMLTALPAAYAGERYYREGHVVRRNSDGELLAAGVLGLAAGAIVAGALADSGPREPVYRERVYDAPYVDDDYFPPRPGAEHEYAPEGAGYGTGGYAYGGLEPWSPGWFRYCEDRYRTFNPSTGTFVGYDGERHFCEVR